MEEDKIQYIKEMMGMSNSSLSTLMSLTPKAMNEGNDILWLVLWVADGGL